MYIFAQNTVYNISSHLTTQGFGVVDDIESLDSGDFLFIDSNFLSIAATTITRSNLK